MFPEFPFPSSGVCALSSTTIVCVTSRQFETHKTDIVTPLEGSNMTDESDEVTPPEGLPDRIVDDLRELSVQELRKAIIHAQELLQAHDEHSSPVEPQQGDDIIRATEHEGYTEVVKEVTCADNCDDCPHGPYLYHVREEPRPEGGTDANWTFIGTVNVDD
jgi:hypothetical protein